MPTSLPQAQAQSAESKQQKAKEERKDVLRGSLILFPILIIPGWNSGFHWIEEGLTFNNLFVLALLFVLSLPPILAVSVLTAYREKTPFGFQFVIRLAVYPNLFALFLLLVALPAEYSFAKDWPDLSRTIVGIALAVLANGYFALAQLVKNSLEHHYLMDGS
jgi:hypothetical protein